MARTHTFKGSASVGCGYFAFIEDGQLVIGEEWGREGGIIYRGSYRDASCYMRVLQAKAPKLYNSITKYYMSDEAQKETITYMFKDSRDCYGYGYYGFIEDGDLVICHEAPREGGVLYRGSYEDATRCLAQIKRCDQRLYDDIEKYYNKHGIPDKSCVARWKDMTKDRVSLRFIGSDGSMGLKKFDVYLVRIYGRDQHICVEWATGKYCPYSSPQALASNWVPA